MAYNTYCLICHRSGKGWSIDQILIHDRLVLGKTLMQNYISTNQKLGGLSKWIQKSHLETWKTDLCLVSAIYLYQLEAPGYWCQIFWDCPDENTAERIRNKLRPSLMDISGYYLLDKLLSDLTQQEIHHYQKTIIGA
jgi:hypothetical protein